MAGGVTLLRQKLGDGDFPLRQAVRAPPSVDAHGAGADGKAAGHEGRAAGRTLAFDVEIEQPQSFRGQLIDARRRRAAEDAAAVAAKLAVTEVVGKHEDDIRFAFPGGFLRGLVAVLLGRLLRKALDPRDG